MRSRRMLGTATIAVGLLWAALAAAPAAAIDYYVNTTIDEVDGTCLSGLFLDCSLRDAVILANDNPGPDTIHVPAGVYNLTIPYDPQLPEDESGSLSIEDDVEILGAGAADTIVDGMPTEVVFATGGGTQPSLELLDLTVSGGLIGVLNGRSHVVLWRCVVEGNVNNDPTIDGGGIMNLGGTMLMFDSVIRNNLDFEAGGGVHTSDDSLLMVIRSTISGNIAGDYGGGVACSGRVTGPAMVWFINSTVTGNEVFGSDTAGGFFGDDCTVIIDSSTFAGNVRNDLELVPSSPGSVTVKNTYIGSPCPVGTANWVVSEGGNVGSPDCGLVHASDIDYPAYTAILLPLGDYGGYTPTMPPWGVGNPLVDNPGADANCALEDQRWVDRPQDGGSGTLHCDTGAVERTLADLVYVFADGFESGDTSAWSSVVP